ncbi:MAG: helix-turn-helix transcriptional regulator [Desulfuromonadales bacterium]
MQAHTKTHRIEKDFTKLVLNVPKALVPSILEYADNLIKQDSGDSIPWRESFNRHFQNDTVSGVCLNSARTTKGLTQAQLAELADIPQRHISEMERGKRGIGKDRASRLAKALDTDYRIFL